MLIPADEQQGLKPSFLRENRELMLKELTPNCNSPDSPQTLEQLMRNLKKWFFVFRDRLNRMPRMLPLEGLSRWLNDYQVMEIEVPGQYTGNRAPIPEMHERIQSFLPDIEIVRRNRIGCRRITVRGHQGNTFKFLLQSSPASSPGCFSRSEERTWMLMGHLNRILEKNKSARRRGLRLHHPVIVPLTTKLRLVQEVPDYVSIEDVYFEFCASRGINADNQLLRFWHLINQEGQSRLNAYHSLANSTPHSLLKDYLSKRSISWNELYMIRKQFSVQTALFGLVCHLLNIGDRSLHNICIALNSGDMFQHDFRPVFHRNGSFARDSTRAMPMRLSRNLQSFFTPFGIEGTIANTITVAAHALAEQQEWFENVLKLFIRDELVAWQSHKAGVFDLQLAQNETLLRATIENCVQSSGKLLEELSPNLRALMEQQQQDANRRELPLLNEKVIQLIRTARSPDVLSQLDPTMIPWF